MEEEIAGPTCDELDFPEHEAQRKMDRPLARKIIAFN
jgi:hypothetical protein